MAQNPTRRQVVQFITIGGAVATLVLPSKWAKPIIETVVIPAHAQASAPTTTTGPTTTGEATTTVAPTTTTVTTTAPTTTVPIPPPPEPPSSDIRLKRDIVRLGTLENGLPLYRFRYLWSDCAYVGVMAQDVLAVMPEAVLVGDDGFMRVRYDLLGIQMVTWAQWPREESPRTMAA